MVCAFSLTAWHLFNDKEIEDIIGKCSAWLPKAMEQVACTAPGDVTSVRCKKAQRDTLVLSGVVCELRNRINLCYVTRK